MEQIQKPHHTTRKLPELGLIPSATRISWFPLTSVVVDESNHPHNHHQINPSAIRSHTALGEYNTNIIIIGRYTNGLGRHHRQLIWRNVRVCEFLYIINSHTRVHDESSQLWGRYNIAKLATYIRTAAVSLWPSVGRTHTFYDSTHSLTS